MLVLWWQWLFWLLNLLCLKNNHRGESCGFSLLFVGEDVPSLLTPLKRIRVASPSCVLEKASEFNSSL